MAKKRRVWAYVSEELDEKLKKLSEEVGLSKSQLISIATISGYGNLIRAIYPEQAVSPEIMASWLKSMHEQGMEIDLDSFKKEAKNE